MGGAGILFVALGEGILALEGGEGLLVLGEVGGCLAVLAEAGEIKAHLVERVVSLFGVVGEIGRVGSMINEIGCGLLSGCWWEGTYIVTVVGLGVFRASAELTTGVLLGDTPLV